MRKLSTLGVAIARLAVDISADQPPSEFRIFVAGWNQSEKGSFLFDDQAAADTMAHYEAHAVDRMIDLEHLSLDEEGRHYDPDARGWCKLEVRNGELWAVDVRWTSDGAMRLREKRQRYISPAFAFDQESRRVTKVVNIAITALPATHGTPELIAARVAALAMEAGCMNPETVKQALDAIENGDAEKAKELLKGLIADAASDEAAPPPAEEEPPAPPIEEENMADEEKPEEEEEEMATVVAATSRLTRITGKTTLAAAVEEVETWRTSHLELEEGRAKLKRERDALEAGERRTLVAELVKLGAETPHTSGLAKKKIVKRLLDEPLSELRERVAQLSAARGNKPPSPLPPANGGDTATGGGQTFTINGQTIELSAREVSMCAEMKVPLNDYAAKKASQKKVS